MTALLITLAVAAAAVTGCAIKRNNNGYRNDKDISGQCGDNLTYEYTAKTGKLSIKGTGEMTSCPWSGYGGVDVKSVEFEEGITSLYNGAFYAQSSLEGDLVLPSTLTYIDEFAFYGTSKLGSVTLSDATTFLGDFAFRQSGIKSINLPDGITYIGEECFDGCENLTGTLKLPSSLETIGRVAFAHCSGLTGDLVIPDSVTSIGDYAFSDCQGFDGTLTISKNLTEIPENCFNNSKGFTGALIIPDSVKVIGEKAFSGCGFSGKITLPVNMEQIGNNAFYDCNGLTGDLVIPDGIRMIDYETFYNCSKITSVSFPDSVKYIGNSAFRDCKSLGGTLNLPEGLIGIGRNAFSGCSSLTGKLSIPDSVKIIERNAFSHCEGFTGEPALPESLVAVREYAFSNCTGLSGELVIPESAKVIGPYAFTECDGIESVTIGQNTETIGNGAFLGCDSLKQASFTNDEFIPDYYETDTDDFMASFPQECQLIIPETAGPITEHWVKSQAELKSKDAAGTGKASGTPDASEEVPYYWTDGLKNTDFYGVGTNADTVLSFNDNAVKISVNDREGSLYDFTADANGTDNSVITEKIWLKDGYLSNLAYYYGYQIGIVKADYTHSNGTSEVVYFVDNSSMGDIDINLMITLEDDLLSLPF